MALIDVHCHVSPYMFPAPPAGSDVERWPCMQCESYHAGSLIVGGKPFRKLDSRSWDVSLRVADMDEDNIALQVLSPMPELLSYWLPLNQACLICDTVNSQIAEMITAAPTRLRGLGAVPLQDPLTAAGYLHRIKNEFSLSGVEIGSNIAGIMLGNPTLDPFYAAAEELGLAILVHALHPIAAKAVGASPADTAFAYFPIDVAMAASSIMLGGVMDRFPKLRIGFSHGGGAIGGILGRLDTGWHATGGYGAVMQAPPSQTVKKMFFDSNVLDRGYLRYLTTEVVPGQVFVGTDYPYDIRQKNPQAFIAELGLPAAEDYRLRIGAAEDFLNESFCFE